MHTKKKRGSFKNGLLTQTDATMAFLRKTFIFESEYKTVFVHTL